MELYGTHQDTSLRAYLERLARDVADQAPGGAAELVPGLKLDHRELRALLELLVAVEPRSAT